MNLKVAVKMNEVIEDEFALPGEVTSHVPATEAQDSMSADGR